MKVLFVIISIVTGSILYAQKPDSIKLKSLIEYAQADTSAFIQKINNIGFDNLPKELIFKLGEIELSLGNVENAISAFEYLKTNESKLESLSRELDPKYILWDDQLEINTKRKLREAYIVSENFKKAMPLIEEDEVTYLDVHADGDWAVGWIKSRKMIDYARCFVGMKDTAKALEYLSWEGCFFENGFDFEHHFSVLAQVFGLSSAKNLITHTFSNPICIESQIGKSEEQVTYLSFSLPFINDTILSPYSIYEYESCVEVPKMVIDSIVFLNRNNDYFRFISE